VDIEPEQVVTMGFEEKVAQAIKTVAAIPGISEVQADSLVHHGFLSLEGLLQAEPEDLAEIPEIGDQAVVVIDAIRSEAARRNAGSE
jgi:N utilization substance protein A